MLDNMTRAYNKATDAAVIAALTAGGTQATAVAASSAGIISYVSTEAPAAYLATGELATKYIAGTSQWSLLLGTTTDNTVDLLQVAGSVALTTNLKMTSMTTAATAGAISTYVQISVNGTNYKLALYAI